MRDRDELEVPALDADARAALAATALPAPAEFAARVVALRGVTLAPVHPPRSPRDAGLDQPRARRRRRRDVAAIAAIAALVLAAAVALVVALGTGDAVSRPAGSGSVSAAERTTVRIGGRAIAVLEPGTGISWSITTGATRVVQPHGDVFYRVEPGDELVVHTPAGEVRVDGTCFRVVVATTTTTTMTLAVTVYEGRVRVIGGGSERRVAAGESVVTQAGSPPGLPGPVAQAPVPDDEAAALRARIRELEATLAALGPDAAASAPGPIAFGHDPGELAAMAAECRITWDLPTIDPDGEVIDRGRAALLGLDDAAGERLVAALRQLERDALGEMRRLYVEVTGDMEHAEELSWDALREEIDHKSRERDVQVAFQRISAERAGLAPPVVKRADLPAVERMYRLLTSLGDDTERAIAAVVGPAHARALRALDGGWGNRSNASRGCPP